MKDPYRYFRVEAEELLEAVAAALAPAAAGDPEAWRTLRRHLHTLKGAARVVGVADVADAVHELEDRVEEAGEEPAHLPAITSALTHVAGLLDAHLGTRIGMVFGTSVEPQSESESKVGSESESGGSESGSGGRAAVDAATAPAPPSHVTVRVPVRSLESLSDAIAGLREAVDALRAGEVSDAQLVRLRREARALEGNADALASVPLRDVFEDAERAAQDASQHTGRAVVVERRGGDLRVDAFAAAQLRAALMHAARNAVAHGFEPPDVRRTRGKPDAGTLQLHARMRGHELVVDCIDDGSGFGPRFEAGEGDLAALAEQGSTAEEVDVIAGRGLGLGAIVDAVRAIDGHARVRSRTGEGTRLRFAIPLTLSDLPVLRVRSGARNFLVPLDAVEGTTRVGGADLRREVSGQAIRFREEWVPLAGLGHLLGDSPADTPRVAVVLRGEDAGQRVALGVGALRGTARARVRAIPPEALAHPTIVGATVSRHARPWLLLDPRAVARAVQAAPSIPEAAPSSRARILLVDDSLTTRMLEQAILEGEGYEVVAVESAELAMAAAHERPFDLFVVDVDMPGMDGFEFVRRTREDEALADVPAIMVTSRTAEADRQRAREVGAAGYMAKGEFDQRAFLALVASVCGDGSSR